MQKSKNVVFQTMDFILFHAASKQYTPVYMSAMCQYTNNDNDHYRNITEKLDKNVHAGNKNDAGGPEMKQDLFCGLTYTCINNINILLGYDHYVERETERER